jgi:hypothetical protein
MRVRTTRTVTAPTQCTSLNGTTQYYSKTTPTGLTFTTTFTCSAWVKLSSYALGGIIARRNADTEGWSLNINADGTITLGALRIASNNKSITSYQSVPLNKWVHVAATMDVSAGDTTAQKIWIDGVDVPRSYAINGTITALVQGTTALVVGAFKSAGTNPFNGKIAQAAVFSAQLSDATIKSYYSQGLSGTETNLISAYSFNNSINDLNTTNANNLTAQGSAVATNADSPFATNSFDTETGTEDYGIVTSVATTTVVVQVPTGNTIPTSGGVSAMSYSTQEAPYGFPILNKFKINVYDSTLFSELVKLLDEPLEKISTKNTGAGGGTLYVSYSGGQFTLSGLTDATASIATNGTQTLAVTYPFTLASAQSASIINTQNTGDNRLSAYVSGFTTTTLTCGVASMNAGPATCKFYWIVVGS